jgi:predicted nucleic acid-binding protein
MDLIVADSVVLVDHVRGVGAATALLDQVADADRRLTAALITKTEIIRGMRSHERRATPALFDVIRWIPIDDIIAELAGEFGRIYSREHPGIDTTEYIVAATAFTLRAELWTRNVKHFPMFPDLEAPY